MRRILKLFPVSFAFLSVFIALFLNGCEMKEETKLQPEIIITSPEDNSELIRGATTKITAELKDFNEYYKVHEIVLRVNDSIFLQQEEYSPGISYYLGTMDMFSDSSIQISAEVLYTNERPTDKDWNYFSVRDYIEDSPETSDSLKSEASITLNLVEHPGGTTSMEFVSFSPATITINGDSSVNIGAFRIGKYEVTNRQYSDFMNSIPIDSTGSYGNIQYIYLRNSTGIAYNGDTFVHKEGMGSMPVVNVTWPGAINFCKWMGGRLPTRLEWYYAADTSYTYSGSNTPENVAWFNGNSGGTPHEVGTKNPNSYGVYDMSGNVAEWCLNWYSQSSKLFKGGHWRSPRDDLKTIRRFHQPPLDAGNYLGFRVLIPQ